MMKSGNIIRTLEQFYSLKNNHTMEQIESFRTASLRNNEDFGFHTMVIKAFSRLPNDPEEGTAPLKAARENYESKFKAFDKAYMQNNKLDEVEALSAADAAVDEAYSASRAFINAMRRHPNETKRETAEEVGKIYDKYGNPVKLGYTEELSVLRNLLQEIKSYVNSFLEPIYFTDWRDYLSEATDELESAMDSRAHAESRKDKGIVQSTRDAADEAYRLFADRVNVVAAYEGGNKYDEFINHVNALIKQLRANQKSRTTRSKNKEDDDLTFEPVETGK